MADAHPICRLDELSDPGSRGARLMLPDGGLEIFLVRRGAQVYAYRNRCPHASVNLEWQPHQFLDLTGHFILCANHGALFRFEDGFCLRGPCAGQRLTPVPVHVEQGRVVVEL
jgi:nitrite reductase/ring-hydroxylating ferredoxin subunit